MREKEQKLKSKNILEKRHWGAQRAMTGLNPPEWPTKI